MTQKIKTASARVKQTGESDGAGTFTAVVSVFDTVDLVGDVVMPGAFTETLAEWKASGDPIPVVWSHGWADPFNHIGGVVNAVETATGLQVDGQLDLENPTAAQVFRLLKGRRITQFSFAYDVLDATGAERDGVSVLELRRLKLHEVGPTLLGAHPDTELLDVKARRGGDVPPITPAALGAWAAIQNLQEIR